MNNIIVKDLIEALKKTLGELEYSLHNQGAMWMNDYDQRQAIIDENLVVKQARKALNAAIEIDEVVGSYGYYQKRNRYHWKINDDIKLNQGFSSKDQCDEWIQEKSQLPTENELNEFLSFYGIFGQYTG